jgi:hypothetical protein
MLGVGARTRPGQGRIWILDCEVNQRMPWNDDLKPNSPAYRIAADPSLSVRVVAGPGTGKSFALKRRVARLLEQGANPRRILPVTFTNVAAEDLQREMMQVGVPGCEEIRGSTLHALGMRILSRQNVLEATGRVARPLNRFEMEPLLYDLPAEFGKVSLTTRTAGLRCRPPRSALRKRFGRLAPVSSRHADR